MAPIDPILIPMLHDLTRGLNASGVAFYLIGGLVPELQLEERPPRLTNDADIVVTAHTRQDFDDIKKGLESQGFSQTPLPYRLRHASGGRLDLLPFGHGIVQDGKLVLDTDHVFNMAGFEHVASSAVNVALNDMTIPSVPLPLYVLLKMVAFSDREQPKDLAGVRHVLRHYRSDDEECYGLEHKGLYVPWDYAAPFLTGRDGRPFITGSLDSTCAAVLDRIDDITDPLASVIIRELGLQVIDDEHVNELRQLFRWYRAGAGL